MRKEKSMSIDFEKEKREELDGANDAKKLSDQVVKLQELEEKLLVKRDKKKSRTSVSRGNTYYDARNEYLYIKIIRRDFSRS
jgi:hypothetical protein